jgi:hypothetical protein
MTRKSDSPAVTPVPRRRNHPLFWGLMLSTLVATGIESGLLERKVGIFTHGFLQRQPLQGLEIPIFLVLSFCLDATIVVSLGWFLYMGVGRIRRLNAARRLFTVCVFASFPLMLADFVKFQIVRYIGDTVEFSWLSKIGGQNMTYILSIASGYLVAVGCVVLLVVGGFAAVFWLLGRVPLTSMPEESPGIPEVGRFLRNVVLLLLASVALVWCTAEFRETVCNALCKKVSGGMVARLANSLTDFDRDGYGMILRPRDFAPFDSRRHPYAVNTPGSGIDANGLGVPLRTRGDFSSEDFGPIQFASRPDFVLIVLESFRYDNVGATLDGKPVTPVLNGLVSQGAAFGKGYSPNAYTDGALNYLFRGGRTLTSQTSLVDDFHANGYFVACVSAQDESFGEIETTTGMTRADFFTDARKNRGARVSEFAAQGSLAIPWTVLLDNIRTFMRHARLVGKPLFLYVNIQDLHFPYNHYAIKPLIEDHSIPRSQITPGNAAWLRRTYRNTAANVDMTIGQILEEFERVRGRKPAFVILGDHGESLFDPELLGHGFEMLEEQFDIPIIANGFAADCVFPMGTGEVRGMIRQGLSSPGHTPRGRQDSAKTVFLHVGDLDRPYAIGIGGLLGVIAYNFKANCSTTLGSPPTSFSQTNIIELWEQIILYRSETKAH